MIIPELLTCLAHQTDTEEYPIDQLSLSAAQRYSVLVTARADRNLNYACFFIPENLMAAPFDTLRTPAFTQTST